jgi:hypothetical protein
MLRPTVSQPVCLVSITQTVAGLLIWEALCDERTGLSFTITAGPRQRSHSWLRVPRNSWPYFTLSDSRLLQPGGPGSPYLYPPGTGWPSYTPRHWVPFSSPPTMNAFASQSRVATDGLSISKSLCWAPSRAHYKIFITRWILGSCFCEAPSLARKGGLSFTA